MQARTRDTTCDRTCRGSTCPHRTCLQTFQPVRHWLCCPASSTCLQLRLADEAVGIWKVAYSQWFTWSFCFSSVARLLLYVCRAEPVERLVASKIILTDKICACADMVGPHFAIFGLSPLCGVRCGYKAQFYACMLTSQDFHIIAKVR